MEEEQNRLHRDHTIAELLGAERRRRSHPRPAGAPAGTPADCARKLRGRCSPRGSPTTVYAGE